MTHFGDTEDVDEPARRARARGSTRGRRWPATRDRDAFIAAVQAEIRRDGSPEQAATYQQAAPAEQLYAGSSATGASAADASEAAWREAAARILARDVADGGVAARREPGQRPGRTLAGGRPQRRPQHLRPRGRDARRRGPRGHARRRLPVRRPDPQHAAARSSGAARARTPSTTGSSSTTPG